MGANRAHARDSLPTFSSGPSVARRSGQAMPGIRLAILRHLVSGPNSTRRWPIAVTYLGEGRRRSQLARSADGLDEGGLRPRAHARRIAWATNGSGDLGDTATAQVARQALEAGSVGGATAGQRCCGTVFASRKEPPAGCTACLRRTCQGPGRPVCLPSPAGGTRRRASRALRTTGTEAAQCHGTRCPWRPCRGPSRHGANDRGW